MSDAPVHLTASGPPETVLTPEEPAVLAALAEAEHDSGNEQAAIAAADAALAIDPNRVKAYVQKGLALFALAAEADDRDAAYRAAREPFLALNRIENDHPLPLIYFNRSFVERGVPPNENATQALERAAELAPFDLMLRLNLATQQLRAGKGGQARANLLPIAYSPHGGRMAEGARAVIDRIDRDAPPDDQELARILAGPGTPDGGAEGTQGGE
jgi:tetratricopeptide (TPR) repeat protein